MSGGSGTDSDRLTGHVIDPGAARVERHPAVDTQRCLAGDLLSALWAGDERRAAPSSARAPLGGAAAPPPGGKGRKAVLFITHDLDEAIAMSDRVVVLSAGPASRPIGEFDVDIGRPRDVAEIKTHPRFIELHAAIWAVLREEVLKGYQQQLAA